MPGKRLRVLFYPFFFLPEEWNGMDEHMRLLSRYLDPARFELLVVEHEGDGPQTRALAERTGVRLLAAPYPVRAGVATKARALRRLLMREKIDIMHIHSPAAGGQLAPALAARLAGVSGTLATYHQVQNASLGRRTRAINSLTHRYLVDVTVAVSHDVAASLVARAGLPGRRLRVVHNGIEPGGEPLSMETGRDEVRLVYVGRLSQEKGVADLLRALARLQPRFPQARTWIAGDGPERANLQRLAADLGIGRVVEFLGFRHDACALMSRADIVVHVPRYEGFGLVLLEAMAAGRPVVTNDAPGGMSEIVVNGETGIVVPAGSEEKLVDALSRLAGDPKERARLGKNGRDHCVAEFSAALMARRTAELYEGVISRRRRLPGPL